MDTMTDLEITLICAQAMGVIVVNDYADNQPAQGVRAAYETGPYPPREYIYDPLRDKGQAFEMIEKFELDIDKTTGKWRVTWWKNRTNGLDVWNSWVTTVTGPRDLNRCVCECVVKVMESQ
jgi:hypothetical protein